MQITLITINYNNAKATIGLLRALEAQTVKDFDVFAVDNDSAGDDRALLGEYAAGSSLHLDVIYSDTNRGFSGGDNLAIRKALAQGSQWMLLINNDTTVAPDFIEQLQKNLPDESCIAGVPLQEGRLTARAGIAKWLRPTLPHEYQCPDSHRMACYAVGAGLLVHSGVFEKIGLLDEQYFLYFEDADFSMRARRAGIPIRFLSEPVIMHRVSESTAMLGHPLLVRYHARNALRFNWRNGPWWAKVGVPAAIIYGIALESLKLLFRKHVPESRATLAGIMDFIRGRWGKIDTRIRIGIECESIEGESWGVGRVVANLLRELAARPELAREYQFYLYFRSRIPDEPFLQSPLFTCVITKPRFIPASFNFHYHVWMIGRAYLDGISTLFFPNYMLPLLWFKKSIVMLTEDIWHEMRDPNLPFRYRLAYAIFANWAARAATRIMAISHASCDELVRLFGIPRERIEVNELAVGESLPVEPMHGRYVLNVGQAFERRHAREIIGAFTRTAQDDTELRLILIGPDKYRPACLDALISNANQELGRPAIQRIERVSEQDLARFYKGAVVVTYVSDMEAFGLPSLEALSYGVPAVVADKPITREELGEHAFFASPVNEEGIAAALRAALTNSSKRNSIRTAAPNILARYTWSAHATRWLAMVKTIENC